VCGPRTLMLPGGSRSWGCTVFPRIEEAIEWADASTCCGSSSSACRAGFVPLLREYNRVYGVTSARLERRRATSSSSTRAP
jgi:aspartate carbamoyltransferase catalytic subunit